MGKFMVHQRWKCETCWGSMRVSHKIELANYSEVTRLAKRKPMCNFELPAIQICRSLKPSKRVNCVLTTPFADSNSVAISQMNSTPNLGEMGSKLQYKIGIFLYLYD